ncbi:uncharacterized protein LOC122197331 [Lactuca sativa]|uniref:uncharacterized protein LOC122197331 n=1 Tax=Lactuca sativa TaxID=4236 RepID=UPI001C690F89|nr:uncharacterized protein LOC122197331 [Lactuca sativa]
MGGISCSGFGVCVLVLLDLDPDFALFLFLVLGPLLFKSSSEIGLWIWAYRDLKLNALFGLIWNGTKHPSGTSFWRGLSGMPSIFSHAVLSYFSSCWSALISHLNQSLHLILYPRNCAALLELLNSMARRRPPRTIGGEFDLGSRSRLPLSAWANVLRSLIPDADPNFVALAAVVFCASRPNSSIGLRGCFEMLTDNTLIPPLIPCSFSSSALASTTPAYHTNAKFFLW